MPLPRSLIIQISSKIQQTNFLLDTDTSVVSEMKQMGTAVNRTNVFAHPRLITFVEKERKTGALHSTTLKLDRLKIPGGGEEGSEGSGGGAGFI